MESLITEAHTWETEEGAGITLSVLLAEGATQLERDLFYDIVKRHAGIKEVSSVYSIKELENRNGWYFNVTLAGVKV